MVRVLICDDAVAFATLVRHWLSRYPDIEVVGTAVSGSQALEGVIRLMPDVIVLDHILYDVPGGSAQLVPLLRRVHPDLGIVLVSGMSADRLEPIAAGCGAEGFVSKASTSEEICEAIRSAAPVESVASPSR
jgi:DNA-binding NarL/FixJ family response regulator